MQDTNLNLQPYFDDFESSKNFYRVLFKPNYPVQARELTTLQSILQGQIEKFGKHVFKEGSVVIPGQIGYDLQLNAVLVQSTVNGIAFETIRNNLVGKTVIGESSGVKAKILNTISSTESNKNVATLYVKYISSGNVANGVQITKFSNGETLRDENNNPVAVTSTQNASSYVGSAAYITSGVFFIRGFFVEVPDQNIILDQYDNFSSYKIGLSVVESLITTDEDNSLYDNAVGSPNFTAPGADRLKIEAILSKQDIDSPTDPSFIELLRLDNGKLINLVENSVYNQLEKNLARRTFDESGNYTVNGYTLNVKETYNDKENNGVYSFNDTLLDGTKVLNRTPVVSDGKAIDGRNYYTAELSPIKAYVKGFEINNTDKKYVTVEKPRKSLSINNQGLVSAFGNYIELEPSTINGTVLPGSLVTLKKTINQVETTIGKAVALSLIIGQKLYLADITMFTTIVTSQSSLAISAGDFIFTNTGATAVVESVSGNTLTVRQTTGTILSGSTFTNSRNTTSYTISSATANKIESITDLSSSNFSAAVKLEAVGISGSSFIVNGATLTGVGTNFSTEVQVPMKLLIGTTTVTTTAITSTSITFIGSVTSGTYYNVKKLVPKIKTTGSNFFSKITNKSVKSSTDFTYYKTITETKTVSGATFTISTTSNFTISPADIIITNSNGVVPFTIETETLTSTSANILVNSSLNGSLVYVTYKVRVNNPTLKTKSASKFNFLLVDKLQNSANTIYGTRISDKDISLKFSDVYKIHAIRQALSSSDNNQNLFDRVSINDSTGLTIGDIITYQNISAKIISISGNTLYIIYISDQKLQSGNNLTLSVDVSSKTPVVGKFITSVTNGNYRDITSDFILNKNDGQEFYNISKLTRLQNSPVPQTKFIVVFDYFIHNNINNDFYSTNSYNTAELSYSEIPSTFEGTSYTDIVDFRYDTIPSSGSGGTIITPYQETISAFDSLALTRVIPNFAFPGEIVNLDYDYYLGRIDKIFLDENGNVVISKGSEALSPKEPEDIPNALLLGTLTIPPYMKSVLDSTLQLVESKRYTMKDIGSIDKRLQTVEELTSLNLLEIGTNSLTVVDEDGNNRFKTGFVADNFKSTSLADLNNVAYTACIDTERALLRPYPYVTNIQLNASNSDSTTQQTGSLVTIPYTETPFIIQNYASRVENLQPFEIIQWYGDIVLNPEKDVWFDTVKTQSQTQRIDLSAPIRFLFDNSSARGEQWGAWTTTGSASTGGGTNVFQQRTGVNNTFSTLTQDIQVGDSINSITAVEFIRSRVVELTSTKLKPNTLFHFFVDDRLNNSIIFPKNITGMTNRVGTFINGETVEIRFTAPQGTPSVSPINNPIRATVVTSSLGLYTSTTSFLDIDNITTADGTEINPDRLGDSILIRGLSSRATGVVSFNGARVRSDSRGTVKAFVIIPPNTYQTGETVFKLCDEITGTSIYGISDSSSQTIYDTLGTRVSLTSNVLSLTTPQITSAAIRGTRTVFIPDPPPEPPAEPAPGRDPLAQSFLVDVEGGIFATSVDLYFQSKDDTLPVSVEIRTMENGTLTTTVVPNSIVTKQSSEVNISKTSSVATRFTFASPIYLNQNTEYAFMVRSVSKNYKIWVSRLSEVDILGGFIIDKQPYSGSLYKSQNMSVWTPDQFEDIKFTLNRAKFATNSTYTCKLKNSPIPDCNLPANALSFTQNSGSIEVYHPNHGMNSVQNYVKISSVFSDALQTSLNTAITSATQTGPINVGNTSETTWTTIGGSAVSVSNPGYILVNDEIIKYTAIAGTTLTIPAGGRGQFGTTATTHSSGSVLYCYSINGIPLSEINKTHKITEVIDLDRYKISSAINANSNLISGGTFIKASRNIQYEELYPNLNILSIPSTNVSVGIESISGNSPYQTASSFTVLSEQSVQNRQYNELTASRLVASPANSVEYYGSPTASTLTFNLSLSTEKDNISPAIDVQGSSAIAISNRIIKKTLNGQVDVSAELTPSSGIYSSYITKKITLQNTSTSVKVLLDGVRTQGLNGEYSDIKVFVKTYSDGNLGIFDSMNYIEIPAVSYPRSSNSNEYKAFDFELKNLPEFKEFAIKVCMISADQTNIPIIRNFRALALAV
jgi:hypothetical protein